MLIWQICITLKFNLSNPFNNKRCIFIPAIYCLIFIPQCGGFTLEPVYLYFIRQPEHWHLLHCAIERLRNGAYTTGQQTSSGLLLPATPESCDFLHKSK